MRFKRIGKLKSFDIIKIFIEYYLIKKTSIDVKIMKKYLKPADAKSNTYEIQ